MDNFKIFLIGFGIGCIFMYFATINNIKITRVISEGEKINSALVSIDIQGKEIQYYMGE